jgi:hypothetical protein
MTPLEFLAVVLPSSGHGLYCACELTDKKDHIFVEDTAEFYPKVDTWVENKCNVYFALATFDERVAQIKGNKDRRTAPNSRFIKALFLDLDGYESKKAAAQALNQFMAKTGLDLLGTPWIVASGGGLHCYWPLEETIDVAVWKPVAENFKRLCAQEELRIDNTVTADSARVLRIPETFNFKAKYDAPRQVRILTEGDTFDFETIAEHIRSQLKTIPPVTTSNVIELPGKRPTAPSSTSVKLFENSVTKFRTIVEKTKAGTGCGQLAHYIENAKEDGMEPLWRGMLSIAQKCEESEKAVVWLSQMHPYDEDRMHTKLREIKGPYPCTKFDSENPGICNNCQHWGKITNPLALGRQYAVETVEKEVEVQIDKEIKKILRPEPPRGYAYGQNGGVFMERDDEDADGNKIKRQIMLLPYDLFPVDILNQNGEHTVHMLAVRKEGAQTITFPQKCAVSKEETLKHLATQNVIASFGSGNDKNLFDFIRACVEKLSMEKAPVKVPSSCGWQADDSFVLAGKIYFKGGSVEVPMPGLENIVMHSQPKGSLEAWRQFFNMLMRKKMWDHVTVVMMSLASPLMRFTGFYGLTVHLGSTESGTGKTLALEAAASVWGHPVHYRTGKGTSPVAMQQRMGLLNSLPLITDEITAKNRKDFEWFPEFLLDNTEGRGKERMESGSNKERLNLSTWANMSFLSSNTHGVDYLTGGRAHSSEGELRRLLEFIMDQQLSWEPHEIEIIKSLANNYAVAGEAFVQFMVENVPLLSKMVPEVVAQMYTEFNATNDERFWMGGIGATIATCVLTSDKHAGIVNAPVEPIIKALKKVVAFMRSSIKAGSRSAEDVLNSFTREYYGNLIVVKYGATEGVLAELGGGGAIDASTTRSQVMGRIEHGVTAGCIDYFIEERLLKAFCSSMSFGYSDFKRQLEGLFIVTHMAKKDMMAKTKGPQMRVPVLKITRRIDEDDPENPLSLVAA